MTAVARLDCWEDARATRLSAGTSAGATSLTVTTGGLASWGPVVAGRFPVVVDRGSAFEEHVYGTAIAGDQITGLTQVDGTPGLLYDHNAAAPVEHGLFAQHVDQPNEFLSLPTTKGDLAVASGADTWARQGVGPNDSVVVADSTQTTGIRWTTSLAPATLILPTSITPAQTADASVVWDSDSDLLTVGTGAGRKTMVDTDSAQTISNKTVDLSSNSVLYLPSTGSPSQTIDGSVVWDTDDNLLTVGDGVGRKTMADTTSAQTLANKTMASPVIPDVAAVGGAWATYSPSWTAAVSNPSIGNGSLTGRYLQMGKLVAVRIDLRIGTTTTLGSGQWRLTLPVAVQGSGGDQNIPGLLFVGAISPASVPASLHQSGASSFTDLWSTAGAVNATTPGAWAFGDLLAFTGVYEAA